MYLKMIKFLRTASILWSLCFLLSCTDHRTISIDSTQLVYNDWGSDQKFVKIEKTQVVPPTVIDYFNFSAGIVFVRQVSFAQECKNGDFSTVITDNYEAYLHLYNTVDKVEPFSVELLRGSNLSESEIANILSKIEKAKNKALTEKSGRCNGG